MRDSSGGVAAETAAFENESEPWMKTATSSVTGGTAPWHGLECWHRISERLRNASVIALFLDFDGTLAWLRPRPDEVSVDANVRFSLKSLARNPRFRVWIISGRRLADLRARVRVHGIRYLGLYGWESRSDMKLGDETHQALVTVRTQLQGQLADAENVWIEEKRYAWTLHYRGAPEPVAARAVRTLNDLVEPFSKLLRVESGKCVREVIPWELGDKGSAVARELAALPSGAAPVYLGDDQPDEPAFAALRGGITVIVGAGQSTHAQYRLSGVSQVRIFLSKLREEFA
jgi:trehalose 6-phosphate phosphatase